MGIMQIFTLLGALMVLGENIGTTITANIAASVGNHQAKRAALSHTFFNVFGVIWALILFKPFLALVGKITEVIFSIPDPSVEGFSVAAPNSPEATSALLWDIRSENFSHLEEDIPRARN